MSGTLYILGVGPGDPELLTMKAVRILQESNIYYVPKGKEDGFSTALSILEAIVPTAEKKIVEIHFPMKKIRMGETVDPEVKKAWFDTANEVVGHLQQGNDVVFPTLGDPSIYSTGFYICQTITEMAPELCIKIIPGVSSIGACAAEAGMPLCLGNDTLAVIPATFHDDRLREILQTFSTVVLMKVYRVMDKIIPLLEELQLLDKATLIEKMGHDSQRVVRDLTSLKKDELHYFATMIIRKN